MPAASASLRVCTVPGICSASPAARSAPIQDLSTFAAVWTTPLFITPGKVTPIRSVHPKELTIRATTSQTGPGSDGSGVSMRRRSPISAPLSRSTRQPLMPLPPMSTPKPRTADTVVSVTGPTRRGTSGSGRIGAVTAPERRAHDADELLELAVRTAREAAELVARGRGTAAQSVDVKSSPVDLVTAVDKACEELVVERLLGARPDDGLLGEEGGERAGTTGVRWIVDPIDGTTNFVYGLPAYAVSIAAEVDGEVRAGVVLNAATGELFTATAGGGAHLTSPGRPESVRLTGSSPVSLDQTLVGTGFGYRVEQRRAQGTVVAQLLTRVRDIRRYGSSALDLCAVAAGRMDAYYELGLKPWDHAAGALIAAEAGLVVTGLAGRPFADPMAVAAAGSIAGPFLELLEELHAG